MNRQGSLSPKFHKHGKRKVKGLLSGGKGYENR
jgi:hypothetical protein